MTASYVAAAAAASMTATTHMAAATAATMASAAAAASTAAATRCKPYAGLKFRFSVKNVKSSQANIKHFLLSEKNALPRIPGWYVCCRRVCRCASAHR
jgi:hypothetical protein